MGDEQTYARAQRIQDRDPDGAANLYRQLRCGPLAARANLALGNLFLQRNHLDGAEYYLTSAMDGHEVKAEVLFALAGLERRRDNRDAARSRLTAYLDLVPDDAEAADLLRQLDTPAPPPPEATDPPMTPEPLRAGPDAGPDASADGPRRPPQSMAEVLADENLTDEALERSPGDVVWSRRPVWWSVPVTMSGAFRTAVLFSLSAVPIAWLASDEGQRGLWLDQLQRLLWAAWPPAILLSVTWAALRWWTTRYTIYERRVEVQAGVLFRVHRGLWLYDVERPVYLTSDPWQTVTGTATVVIESDRLPARSLGFYFQYQKAGTWGQLKLSGFGVRGEPDRAVAYLTRQILRERRALKDRFV